jgi:hypothetical protein
VVDPQPVKGRGPPGLVHHSSGLELALPTGSFHKVGTNAHFRPLQAWRAEHRFTVCSPKAACLGMKMLTIR